MFGTKKGILVFVLGLLRDYQELVKILMNRLKIFYLKKKLFAEVPLLLQLLHALVSEWDQGAFVFKVSLHLQMNYQLMMRMYL